MKSFLKAIILSLTFFFTACSSDLGEFSQETELPQEEKTCCEAAVTTGDSLNISNGTNTRGWDEISGDQYPFDCIYMISKAGNNYNSFSPNNVQALPVINNPDISSTDICFKCEGYPSKVVYLTTGGKNIEIDNSIFSSESNGKATMEVSSSIQTPEGQTVYEPYGDRLFFSDRFNVVYDAYTFRGGKFKLIVYETDDYGYEHKQETTIKKDEHLNIPLKRFTTIVNAKLVISDMEPLHIHDVSKYEFEKKFGSLDDWSVRIFLENAATTFTYADRFKHLTGNDIVALTKEKQKMSPGQSHYSEYDILGIREWRGIGLEDNSNPYIFPTYLKESDTKLCFSFYYTGDDDEILEHTTLKVPIYKEGLFTGIDELKANTKHFLTVVIDIEDFEEGVTGEYGTDSSRSGVAEDSLWGYVMDVPYETTITVEKMN